MKTYVTLYLANGGLATNYSATTNHNSKYAWHTYIRDLPKDMSLLIEFGSSRRRRTAGILPHPYRTEYCPKHQYSYHQQDGQYSILSAVSGTIS